ncbi:MAG: hypothetical protein U9Q12_00420 [Patescibacteria group bacterium]|nr:hypothetical protein [Patescibacteria group bacterium]
MNSSSYEMHKPPIKITEEMKKSAKEAQEKNDERAGTQETEEQSMRPPQWQAKINEQNLRDDHSAYEDKNVK